MSAQPVHPFHVEAYPRLDLAEAVREVNAGRDHLLWRDQEGTLVGIARVTLIGEDRLTIAARFRHLSYVDHGHYQYDVAISQVRRDNGRNDVVTRCPGCSQQRRYLVLASTRCLCRTCQHLVYRSTIISARVRETERLAELNTRLAAGRPLSMRTSVYAELLREREWLRHMVGDAPAVASLRQRCVLSTFWQAEPPALFLLGELAAPGAAAGLDVLELLGEPLFAGKTLRQQVEADVRNELATGYAKARALTDRVSQLRLRRHFRSIILGEVPTLDQNRSIVVVDGPDQLREARLALWFEGDAGPWRSRPPLPTEPRLPRGRVFGGELMLAVRFSADTAPFVPVLLEAELELIEHCLERQRQAREEVQTGFAAVVKEVVAQHWSKVKPTRNRAG